MNQPHLPFGPRWFRPSPTQWEREHQESEEWFREHRRKSEEARRATEEAIRELYELFGLKYRPPASSAGAAPAPASGRLPVTAPMRALGLKHPFNATDVNRAWKLRAAAVHPDRGGSAEKFIAMTRARDELLRGLEVHA